MPGKTRSRRADSVVREYRLALSELVNLLGPALLAHDIDEPDNPAGEWWLDLTFENYVANVAWRHGQGFGLFTAEEGGGFGMGPDEIFREPGKAAKRLLQLVEAAQQPGQSSQMRLSDVRKLMEASQVALADRLHKDQAVISRLERQNDALLSTIRDYVAALGGELSIAIRFADFVAPLHIPETDDEAPRRSRNSTKSEVA